QKYITWQPGNGTRYDIILTQLTIDTYGQKAGTWMVVGPWADRARVMFLTEGGYLDHNYVGEKLGIGPHDASVVAMMVAPHIGREAITLDNLFEHYAGAGRTEPTVTVPA
ncbi:MAG: hypothetical protein EBT79_13405, partial [Actinobacteria bacterium]|nr:hypothetical protein [Actinomycetota bacterium]